MKLIALALLYALPVHADAPLCGTIYSYIVRPVCENGRPCPRWLRLQYAMLQPGGKKQNLSAAKAEILEELAHYRSSGKGACVTGKYDRAGDTFRVDAIRPE